MWKKLGIGVVVLLLLIAGGAYYLFSNLDGLIKQAIETYGSAATGAPVGVGSVKLSLQNGAGAINGLSIGNPAGFSSPEAMSAGQIAVTVDTSSIAGSGPIIIDQVSVAGPHVTYELPGLGKASNLQTIEQNVNAYAASMSGGQASQGSAKPARKEIIRNLDITGGEVSLASSLLGGKSVTVPLPPIHLTNVGGAGGASPAVIIQQALGTVVAKASTVGASALSSSLGTLSGAAGNAAGAAKGAVGGAAGSVGSMLKGF
ncbi:hypothetical protein [Acidocella sp.]|uniref:hypothetical protein n=1 Tax=Acidocella sp. TaxID=50710 RepID=UPI00262B7510|nr:hypothetical protein [Acidocella sp.]